MAHVVLLYLTRLHIKRKLSQFFFISKLNPQQLPNCSLYIIHLQYKDHCNSFVFFFFYIKLVKALFLFFLNFFAKNVVTNIVIVLLIKQFSKFSTSLFLFFFYHLFYFLRKPVYHIFKYIIKLRSYLLQGHVKMTKRC